MFVTSCILGLEVLLPQGGAPDERGAHRPTELGSVEALDLSDPDSPVKVLRRDERDEHIEQIVWQLNENEKIQLPLTKPVLDLDVALSPNAGTLVVLAGGVRAGESLVLYLVSRHGGIHVFDTSGGRRLPARFNGGLGSWPIMEGEHLVLFAYSSEGNLEFRALDTHGHVYASRTLASQESAIPGFRARCESGKVSVSFGEGETLEFPHPLAPRLEVSEGMLDFGRRPLGRPASRTLEVRNSGRRDLELSVFTSTGEFEAEDPETLTVRPGGREEIRIRYLARALGHANDRLDIVSNAGNGLVSVSLHGEALLAESVVEPEITSPRGAATDPPDPAPAPVPEPRPPAPPRTGLVDKEPRLGTVLVRGWLAAPPEGTEPPRRVRVRAGAAGPRTAALGPGRAFEIEVPASPGDALFLAVEGQGGRTSPEVGIGRVEPTLDIVDQGLSIRGPAQASFVLAAVQLDPEGERIQRVLEHWTGRLDLEGSCRLAPGELGLGSYPVDLVVLLPDHGEPWLRSNRVQWPNR